MLTIDDTLAAGGEIDVPGGFMRKALELFVGGEKVSELAWEAMPSGRAFYDSGEGRYEITVPKKSRFTWKRTVQVRRVGEVAAELHSNRSGSSGDVITSWRHRYTFRSSRAGVAVTRDVGLEVVLTYAKRSATSTTHRWRQPGLLLGAGAGERRRE
jgi:hypothetical protein